MPMKQVGNKDTIAFEFALAKDPDSNSPPEVASSWGRIRVWVAGRNLTNGVSAFNQVLDAAECPLLPIVRWFIDNWDPLFHEERLPRTNGVATSAGWHAHTLSTPPLQDAALDRLLDDRSTWWHHHSMGAALPGFRIPDVHFRRLDEDIEISWNDREWRSVPGGVRLSVDPGAATVPVGQVCDMVAAWCRELLEEIKDSCDVTEDLKALDDLGSASRLRPRLKLAAGLDHLQTAASQIRRAAGVFDGSLDATVDQLLGISGVSIAQLYARFTVPVMLYRSASPALSEQDLFRLFSVLAQLPDGTARRFVKLRSPVACPRDPEAATQDGYERAVALRNALSIPADEPLAHHHDLERVALEKLGINSLDITLDDRGVEGVALWMPTRLPVIAINSTGRFSGKPWGRRMTLAHELCHLMHDGSEDLGLGLASNPWAPRLLERRANAFAAMFIAPRPALEQALGPHPDGWDPEDLSNAMRKLGVGATTLCRHLENLGMISQEQSEGWLNELASRG